MGGGQFLNYFNVSIIIGIIILVAVILIIMFVIYCVAVNLTEQIIKLTSWI